MVRPWDLDGKRVSESMFGALSPKDVLIDYGYPVLFTSYDTHSQQVLVFYVEDVGDIASLSRFLVAPTSSSIVAGLRSGEFSIRDALTRSWLWAVEVTADGTVQTAYEVTPDNLPADVLPANTTMISAALEPAITVKYMGKALSHTSVPASILQAVGSAVQAALRELTDFLAGNSDRGAGRRANKYRQLYNLPANRIAFGSLEISFGRPAVGALQAPLLTSEGAPLELDEIEARMWQMLNTGLRWLASGSDPKEIVAESDEERLAVVRALENLTPTAESVDEVVIGGRMVARRSAYRLNKGSRSRVQQVKRALEAELKTHEEERIFVGLVRAFDLDKQSFVLRTNEEIDAGDLGGTVFLLLEDDDVTLADEVNHDRNQVMTVIGRRRVSPKNTDPPWDVVLLRQGASESATAS